MAARKKHKKAKKGGIHAHLKEMKKGGRKASRRGSKRTKKG